MNTEDQRKHIPNPKLHKQISIIKSLIRFGVGGLLIIGQFEAAGLTFILAEFLGIVEELV